jgi:hypothetical protein
LERYIHDLHRACAAKRVIFRFDTDVNAQRDLLAPFNRVVIASGASYRFGLGPITRAMLDWGVARWPGLSRFFSSPRFRNWFYYRTRRETGSRLLRLGNAGQVVMVIGDAARAGKSKEAIASAFDAALLGIVR